MHISNSEIRAKARESLDGKIFGKRWLLAVLGGLIISAVLGAANYLCAGIATMLLCGPLYVGLYKFYLNISNNQEDIKVESVFDGCYNFSQNFMVGLMQSLLIFLWSLLFVIPGIVKSYSYALVYYIKAENPEMDWRQCLSESEIMMKGNKWRLFKLHFSFIGWMFFSLFTLGIGSLWVNAYMQVSTAVLYEEIKRERMYAC